MGISLLPDADGLSLLGGVRAYQTYHHVLSHNLTFCLMAVAVIAVASRPSAKATVALLGLFHLHLIMDLFGSGPGWGISYLWPWNSRVFCTAHAWSFRGWQNYLAFSLCAVWCLVIALRFHRTPLESIAPRFDLFLLRTLGRLKIQNEGNVRNHHLR